MTDYLTALAALREALDLQAKVGKADTIARFAGHARVTKRARDLLAALDAVRGEAVAWQAKLKIGGCERWTEWGEVDDIEHFKRFHDERGNAYEVRALYAAPPAALAVPSMLPDEDKARTAFWGCYPDGDSDKSKVWMTAYRWCRAVLAAPAAPAAAVPDGYAGCTLWRDGLRVTVIDDEVIEQRADADEAFCELAQRALDSLAAAWDSRNAAMLAAAERKGE